MVVCLLFEIRLSKFIQIQNKAESRYENETQKIKKGKMGWQMLGNFHLEFTAASKARSHHTVNSCS